MFDRGCQIEVVTLQHDFDILFYFCGNLQISLELIKFAESY